MEMFNAKDRRHPSMDDHMNLKKPGFGGPSSKKDFNKSERKTLAKYQRVVDRNKDFEGGNFNHNYDTTWKAVTRDLISRTAKKKPFEPMYAKNTIATTDAVEEGRIFRFEEFISENFNMFAEAEEEEEENPFGQEEMNLEEPESELTNGMEIPEVDEEKLESLIEDYGSELKDLVEDIAEKLEIEKEEAFDLLLAAVHKMKTEPEEENEEDEENEEEEDEKKEEKEEEGA
jgi:hypothetical protein